ncbi:MAG: hypothetical protein AAGA48_33595, partial [Myxococcota bacterium]
DAVAVDAVLPSAPRWWILEVYDENDVLRLHERVAASGVAGVLQWDGRDDAGIVVDAGSYTLQIGAEDWDGQRSGTCDRLVIVDHGPQDPS